MPFRVRRAEGVRGGNVTLILRCRCVVRVLQFTLGISLSLFSLTSSGIVADVFQT
jgi:hypothetical protein